MKLRLALCETLAGLDMLKDAKFITDERFIELQNKIASICNQIGGFQKTIKQKK